MLSTKHAVRALCLLAVLVVWRNLRTLAISDSNLTAASPWSEEWKQLPLSLNHSNISSLSDKTSLEKSALNETIGAIHTHKLIHLAIFGLGHRLTRAAAAWHLAQRLNMTKVKFQWGTCGKTHDMGPSIFPYLFQNDEWDVPTRTAITHSTSKNMLIRNDVYGYLPGQTFMDHRIQLDPAVDQKLQSGPLALKLQSDVQLYQLIRERFAFRQVVDDFRQQHDFENHYVVGLHLRAGNGEGTHFTESGRYLANETEFVDNLLNLVLETFLSEQKQNYPNKPPLLFLATDTAYLVPRIVEAAANVSAIPGGVKAVVLPQIRVETNAGVTYKALSGEGERCLLGWQAMMADMSLLSYSNVLIAARHSTFTQSLPLALVMNPTNIPHDENVVRPRFCEVDANATGMTCLSDISTWLFRNDPSKQWSYSRQHPNGSEPEIPVQHKILVHLPEPKPPKDFDDVLAFLQRPLSLDEDSTPTHSYGGNRFNPRYRRRKPAEVPAWNFSR